jgi:hypothetical protein
MFALPDSFSVMPRASCPVFMFCASVLIFDGTAGVRSRFHVLCSCTHFRRYRGCRVPFSCFALPDSFSAVPRASVRFFMFCAPGLVFGGTEVVGFRFHVLRSRSHFQRYRGYGVPFSCFALSDSFSAVPRASGPFFLFCAPELFFGGIECRVPFSCFVRRVPVPCFTRPDSFWTVPRVSGPVFMYCAPGLVFGGTVGVGSYYHVLRAQTHFKRCRVRRVPFSSIRRSYSFSAVPWASGPVFMFYAPGPVFMFCAPRVVSRSIEGVRSRFHVLRARTHFRLCRVRRVPLSSIRRPYSFSAVPWASGPVFMFYAPGPVFIFCAPRVVSCSTEGVRSRFNVLHSRTRFPR